MVKCRRRKTTVTGEHNLMVIKGELGFQGECDCRLYIHTYYEINQKKSYKKIFSEVIPSEWLFRN